MTAFEAESEALHTTGIRSALSGNHVGVIVDSLIVDEGSQPGARSIEILPSSFDSI